MKKTICIISAVVLLLTALSSCSGPFSDPSSGVGSGGGGYGGGSNPFIGTWKADYSTNSNMYRYHMDIFSNTIFFRIRYLYPYW